MYLQVPKDTIVFISGVPGSGKTTVAYELFKNYCDFRIVEETDIIREILRGYRKHLALMGISIPDEITPHNVFLDYATASRQCEVMMNSIMAAQHPHTFLLSQWEVHSKGNPLAHAILRGSVNKYGRSLPNYHYEDLSQLYELYAKSGLANPVVIIDTNHSNSGKQWDQQARIAKEVLHSTRHNGDIGRMVKGLMIESYLLDGCQKPDGGVYGLSITDPCIGWEKTEQLVLELAELRG